MHITRIKINDYKSYFKTPTIELEKGINLIVGKNNVGKTAFLEALTGEIFKAPHINSEKKPRKKSKIKTIVPSIELGFYCSKTKAFELSEDKGHNDNLFIYTAHFQYIDEPENAFLGWYRQKDEPEWYFGIDEIEQRLHLKNVDYSELQTFFLTVIENGLELNYSLPNQQIFAPKLSSNPIPSNGDLPVIELIAKDMKISLGDYRMINPSFEISNMITKDFIENRIFKFDIHRTVKGSSLLTGQKKLLSNCENLPTVLDHLRSDPKRFKEYVDLVKEVFSEIKNISINHDNGVEIRIWMPQSHRPDLTIPLSACGTGIGQVMAMFYLLVQSDESQVIIIDEPNSFLHPSACRKLIEIFKRFPQHQYIISTHSPEIISRAESNNTLLLTINDNGQTEVQKIDRASHQGLQTILNEVGVKLSDVYGYDKVLWVEGDTEELCFPEIIQHLIGASTANVPVLQVHDTGSFGKKHIKISLDIYHRLSNGTALLPPAIAFIFDREDREDDECNAFKEIAKRKGVEISFLERRLYENYLLNTDAIFSILDSNAKTYEWEDVISKKAIEDFFVENKSKKEYWDKKNPSQEKLSNWKNNIHAAKLLKDLFNNLSGTKLSYKKTTHSVELTKWLIKNKPSELEELKELLSKFYTPI